jgi:hypothetical protein
MPSTTTTLRPREQARDQRIEPNQAAAPHRHPQGAAHKPPGVLSARCSTGPDGRLSCAWILSDAGGTDRLQGSGRLAPEPIRAALAAY